MKLSLVNTYLTGGAAKGAKELFDLVSNKFEFSDFVFLSGGQNCDLRFINYSQKYWFNNLGSKKISRIISEMLSPSERKIFLRRHVQDSQYDIFSYPRTIYSELYLNSELIHLNWVADFINYPSFFKTNNKAGFVWTLRDMNPFTGGCHHSDDCKQYIEGCISCPQLKKSNMEKEVCKIFKIKEKALKYLSNDQLKVVCPSNWVMNESKKSKLLGRFEHILIPHGIDVSEFKAKNKNICRTKNNLPLDEKIVVFVSDFVSDERKGLPLLVKNLKKLRSHNIMLISVGRDSVEDMMKAEKVPFKYKHLGFINERNILSEIYNSADVFISPSMAESFGFTVVESLCCGTPVIAFDTSAIAEKIDDTANGYLVKLGNESDLVEKINNFFDKGIRLRKEEISDSAVKKYSSLKMKDSYLKLYDSILSHRVKEELS